MNARSGANAEDSAHLRRRARRDGTEDVYRVGAAAYRVAVQEHHDLRQPRRCGVWVWRERAGMELPDKGKAIARVCWRLGHARSHSGTGAQGKHALL